MTDDDLDEILSKCSKTTQILVGAKRKGQSKIVLYDSDNCQSALKYTDSVSEAVKGDGNGFWYRVKGKSFGFAPSSVIDLEKNGGDVCDKSCEGDQNKRLSLRTSGQKGGFRVGAE